MTEYPQLWQFFGGYMHQDWQDDYQDEWAAVEGFARDAPTRVESLRAEMATLLAQHPSEEEVRKIILDDLGSCYLADVNGWNYRDWLQALSDHAEKAIGHPQAS